MKRCINTDGPIIPFNESLCRAPVTSDAVSSSSKQKSVAISCIIYIKIEKMESN